jgi:hypothetical protein
METHHVEEKMSILLFKIIYQMNLKLNQVLILVKIKWLFKELEKLLKKLKLNYHLLLKLILIYLI